MAPRAWQMFRHITLPLVWPHIVVALVIRTIDALKAFDTHLRHFSNGGPGTASETLNHLPLSSDRDSPTTTWAMPRRSVTVIFFILILLISLVLFSVRQAGALSHA